MRKILFLLLASILFMTAKGQQLFTEEFDYTSGQPITSNGWSTNGFPMTNPINVSSPGLSYGGYVLSGNGNAVYLNNNGIDVFHNALNASTSGSVYTSFTVKLDTVKTGDYAVGLLSSTNLNNYFGRVYFKAAASGYYKIGLSKSNDTAVYSADSFAIGGVALIVLKYSIATGLNNDSVSLFHFKSGFPTTEPSPLIFTNGKGSPDATNINSIALRQGNIAQAPSLTLDGIRMAKTWADLNTPTIYTPLPIQFIFVNNITSSSARINLIKPTGYLGGKFTMLLFLKKGTAIDSIHPTNSAASYTADTNFLGNGTPYQYDTAKCVYNGDSNLFVVTGLTPVTRYILLGFTVTEGDSVYSNATISASFITTSTAPGTAFGLNFNATSTTSARISWNRGNNYDVNLHTQVVFIKEMYPITTGINTANPYSFTGDTSFIGLSSRYPFDTAARCIYNGDLNTVTVTGLKPGTRYYVMVLGANVFDSVYSNPANATGITPTGGPAAIVNFRFTGKMENNSIVSWAKPAGYVDSTHSILIFMRKDTMNLTFPAATLNPLNYIPDSNLANNGTPFEFDSQAKCIYNGDGNSVMVGGLTINTMYYFVAYVVKTDSGLYSLATLRNGRTMLDSATNLSFKGVNTSSATVTWTQPANFAFGTYNALVFVKAGSPMTVGTPSRALNRITANPNFGSGSKYQNDSNAYCVLRGNTNTITVNNLKSGITYYATVFIVRVTDSVYNHANTVAGSVLGAPNFYTIGSVTKVNPISGVADSSGVRAMVKGVVYGGNVRGGLGVQFVLRDATGGISILSTNKNFGYTVKEGDSIETAGTVSQLSGLTVLINLDTIRFLNAGNNIAKPKTFIVPNEASENDLVIFPRLILPTPIANWPNNGTVVAQNLYTGDTVRIRFYNTSGIGGTPAPAGEFSLTGLGGQTSSSNIAPFPFDGYTVAPRRLSDISLNTGDTISNFPLRSPRSMITVDLTGDTNLRFTFSCGTAKIIRGIGSVNYVMLFDESNGDFSLPIVGTPTNNLGLDTVGSISHGELLRILPLKQGDSVLLKVTMSAFFNSISKMADQEQLVYFKAPKTVSGLGSVDFKNSVLVYPNPANSFIQISASNKILKLHLYDIQGKLVIENEMSNEIATSDLNEGMYLLSIETENGRVTKRVEIKH